MENIKLSEVRISGFRGLKDFSFSFEDITVITGCNNVGKTSLLKALQLALGNSNFLNKEDFFFDNNGYVEKIVIDLLFFPVDEKGKRIERFSDDWESVFTESCIQYEDMQAFVGLRTTINYEAGIINFPRKNKILKKWNPDEGQKWQDLETTEAKFNRDSIPFFYIEAQRDIVEDTKSHNSYIGKMLSDVSKSYKPKEIKEIEDKIKQLNEYTISSSNILKSLQKTLKEIESAIDNDNSKVFIMPFTKNIHDLNKGVTIHYGNDVYSYTMDYHGMGTRSWASILTFKSFIQQKTKSEEKSGSPFYPIIAIEEPEAHLHPDAQRRLYLQISEMPGQKIISTHSPYIASTAEISNLRNMYKKDGNIVYGNLSNDTLDSNDERLLKQKIIRTKGEIIFAKALVFFEGETEDQALPIFASKFFQCNPVSFGLDFVSVGGNGNYYPFIYLAKHFNIPWFIFSDGDQDTPSKILKAYNKLYKSEITDCNKIDNIFIIERNANFEQMLINEGYKTEIEKCLKQLLGDNCVEKFRENYNKEKKKSPKYDDIIDVAKDEIIGENEKVLYKLMSKNKTSFAPLISEEICQKGLPSLVIKLFNKIKENLHI